MQDIEFCQELLKLDDAWSITEIEIDKPSNRLDITIRFGKQKKKSFFSRGSDDSDQELITLRHLPVAEMRTYLHVPKPGSVESGKIWATAGSPFTKEMEEHIVQTLNSCRSNLVAAKLLGITAAEAREISERTGAGSEPEPQAGIPAAAGPAPAAMKMETVSTRSFDLETSTTELPVETDECWQRLINGEIPIQSGVVGLQMLLQRVRQQIANNPSEVTRLSSARLLRQYFVKNAHLHPAEIGQLSGAPVMDLAAPAEQASGDGIPAESAPVWNALINGEKRILTGEVGLQMMLERVRLSVERNPSESARTAGIRILREYFQKHKHRLASEIEQIGGQARRPVPPTPIDAAAPATGVPAENQPAWTSLINGEIRIDTNAVGLQMMLERVRLSVERNPSEDSKRAGIKLLRQFFLKHQERLQDEIRQLNGGTTASATVAPAAAPASQVTVPSEQHENWQALVNGELRIDTDNVALQMMLERVRLSVERNPTESTRRAGIRILRQFFLKHRARLQNEILQLGGTAAAPSAAVAPTAGTDTAPREITVPPESHPSWQRLINGELEIKTDIVALKMMLERIRISIGNNPTDASRLAGARILRQYFLKHQNKHRAEIDQLLAA